jgi:hypothetical protein
MAERKIGHSRLLPREGRFDARTTEREQMSASVVSSLAENAVSFTAGAHVQSLCPFLDLYRELAPLMPL